MELIRRAVTVRGRVQGVSFRYYTELEAVRLGLDGWVRNAADGTVEMQVQGPAEEVESFLRWLRIGSPHAVVESVTVTEIAPIPGEDGFHVRP